MDYSKNKPAPRESALKYIQGFYMWHSDEERRTLREDKDEERVVDLIAFGIVNGKARANDSKPLSAEEKSELIKLIKNDSKVRGHYINMVKSYANPFLFSQPEPLVA